nr:MAG: hypothetical protein [Porcellio scaber clopovirus]
MRYFFPIKVKYNWPNYSFNMDHKNNDNKRNITEVNKKMVKFLDDQLFPRVFNRTILCRRNSLRIIEKDANGSTASEFLPMKRFSNIPFQAERPSVVVSILKSTNENVKKRKKMNRASLLNLNKDPSGIGTSTASRNFSSNGTFQNMTSLSDFSTLNEYNKGICDFQEERVCDRNASSSTDLLGAEISTQMEKFLIPLDFEKYVGKRNAAVFEPGTVTRDAC